MRQINVGRPENQRRDLIIVAVLIAASWALASLDSSAKLGFTRVLRSSALRPFLAAEAVYEARAALSERASRLEVERDRLYRELLIAADLDRENRDLRALLDLPDRAPGDFVLAELVPGRPAIGDSHTFLVRAPGLASVEVPAGVVVPDGLVGVLRSRQADTGLGEFWTHPDFRVSVRSAVGGATGIVRPVRQPDGALLMLVEGVPYEARIPAGALLETAGLGGVFPPGVSVGRVLEEAESRSGWSHSYLVEPSVRPGSVAAVTVWARGGPATLTLPVDPPEGSGGERPEAEAQPQPRGGGDGGR